MHNANVVKDIILIRSWQKLQQLPCCNRCFQACCAPEREREREKS